MSQNRQYTREEMIEAGRARRRTNSQPTKQSKVEPISEQKTEPKQEKKQDAFLEGFNFYESTRPAGTTGMGIKILTEKNPFIKNRERPREVRTEQKPVSMPVGGDIENDDEMELFLSGMREETALTAGNGVPQKNSVDTSPEQRSKLVKGYEKELSEKSRSAVYRRVYEEEYKKDPEKAFLTAILAADNDKKAQAEEKRLKKEINTIEFAKDIEAEGRRRASEAAKKEFELAKARGDMNPAVASMEKGDEVLAYYNKLAADARNGLYYHDLNNEIAGYEKIREDAKFGEKAERGKATIPYSHSLTKNALGKEIVNFINDDAFAGMYSAIYKKPYDAEHLSMLTEGEKNVMRAYAADGDLDSVEKYYDLLERQLNERVQNKKNEETRENSYERPFLNSAGNVASSFATPLAYFSNMGQAVKNGITGDFEPTDINSPAFRATHYGEHSENGIVDRVYDTFGGGELGDLAASVARGGLSVARDVVKKPLKKWAMPFEIFGSAGEETYESLKQGKDSGETLGTSSIKGTVAGVLEKLQAGKELESILDTVLFGGNSGYQRAVDKLMADGLSKQQAEEKAVKNILRETLFGEGPTRLID